MNIREKSLIYSIILILPTLWGFLTFSDLNNLLKLYIVVPTILTIMLFLYLSKPKKHYNIPFQRASNCFVYFSLYMITISFFAGNVPFALKLILIISTVFSFAFLGENIKFFGYIGYIYAIISAVIILDYNSGGLTVGWNPNAIGLIAINGVYLLFLSIDLEDKYGMIIKIAFSALLLILIANTNCRSVYVGFFVFIIIRYVIFNLKSIPKSKYKIICTFLMIIPYLTVQLYLFIYDLPNAKEIDEFIFDLTEKQLFSGREYVWKKIIDASLYGIKIWFGTGARHGNPHSIYIDILYSYGIIGVVFFAVFFLLVIFALYKYFKDPVIKTCIACFYGMLIMQSFETVSFGIATESYNNILYMFLALAIGRYIHNEKQSYKLKSHYKGS